MSTIHPLNLPSESREIYAQKYHNLRVKYFNMLRLTRTTFFAELFHLLTYFVFMINVGDSIVASFETGNYGSFLLSLIVNVMLLVFCIWGFVVSLQVQNAAEVMENHEKYMYQDLDTTALVSRTKLKVALKKVAEREKELVKLTKTLCDLINENRRI